MRVFRISAVSALLVLAALFAAPACAHADTYAIASSWSEDSQGFDGIDQNGAVYLQNFYTDQYSTHSLSGSVTTSSTMPSFTQDRGTECTEIVAGFYTTPVSGLCNDGRFAFLASLTSPGDPNTDLFVYTTDTATLQLITADPFGDLLALNSQGDIVFDNGFTDIASEVVDYGALETAEPASILLFGSGLFVLGVALYRRRVAS